MIRVRRIVASVLMAGILAATPGMAGAASPAAGGRVGSSVGTGTATGATIASVGTIITGPIPAPRTPPASPLAGAQSHSWMALDGAAYAEAKAAANAAAPGGTSSPSASTRRKDFTISASPSSLSILQGGSATSAITTTAVGGAGTVNLSVTISPSAAGVTASVSPASVIAGGSATLTVAASSGATVGSYTVTVKGQEGPVVHSTAVAVTVSPATVAPDFSISAAPASLTVVQGASGTSQVMTTAIGGAGIVNLAVSVSSPGLGVGASAAPPSVAAGGGATLTVTADAGATPGDYTVTVKGTEGSNIHTTQVAVTVTAASGGSGPVLGSSWQGEAQGGLAPPDPTGAMGPNSYLELINLRYGIYRRDKSLVGEGDLGALTGLPVSELSDPQVVWDPGAQRFYYLVLDTAQYAYAFGYSTTADPTSAGDFCRYIVNGFGYLSAHKFPDYPKLAVTQDFVLVGTNVFLLASIYQGSDLDWFQKPAASPGTAGCPPSLGAGGIFSSLTNANGSKTSTPVPAVNADPSATGFVVGSANVGTGSANYLSVFKVTKGGTGSAVLSTVTSVPVASYSTPADAVQKDVAVTLDTMDTRLTHAVAAVDPRLHTTAIWTAHTVFGGAGAEVRWYEIAPGGTPNLAQSGAATDPSLFVWNGAIAPDRANNGTTGTFGSDMVMGFNTSSSVTYPALQMVSKRGTAAQSGFVSVWPSLGPNQDFTCASAGDVCRWGDYAGASADPLPPSGSAGQVWLSGEWNLSRTDGSATVWQTWNWAAVP